MADLPEMSYGEAMQELVGHAEANELPIEVTRALTSLFKRPEKLLVWNPDPNLASGVGASNLSFGLQASNLLVKLVLAARALDWEVIIVAGEQHGATPSTGEHYIRSCWVKQV